MTDPSASAFSSSKISCHKIRVSSSSRSCAIFIVSAWMRLEIFRSLSAASRNTLSVFSQSLIEARNRTRTSCPSKHKQGFITCTRRSREHEDSYLQSRDSVEVSFSLLTQISRKSSCLFVDGFFFQFRCGQLAIFAALHILISLFVLAAPFISLQFLSD